MRLITIQIDNWPPMHIEAYQSVSLWIDDPGLLSPPVFTESIDPEPEPEPEPVPKVIYTLHLVDGTPLEGLQL